MVNVQVNGVTVTMELDTGAAVPVMSQQQQKKLFPMAQLQPSKVTWKKMKVAGHFLSRQ